LRIHLLSDLHLEFATMRYQSPECDVVVLAGDIATGVAGVMWAAETFKGVPVVYVAGNHEFYGKRRLHRHIEKLKEKAA
jgi:predicted phosphodiesterase